MQIVIDSCKREYEIDANQEIERIASLPYMTMTREIERNGKTKTIKYDFPSIPVKSNIQKMVKNYRRKRLKMRRVN